MWKASPIENINVTRAEVLFAINKRAVHLPSAFNAGEPLRLYRFIDVRSEKAYLGNEGLGKKVQIPNIDAVNIPWREFFAKGLRPNPEILQRLSAVGVTSDCRIIVLDEDGVASAAVTMALQQLGFPFAGNYAGGLNDLMSQPGAVTTPSN